MFRSQVSIENILPIVCKSTGAMLGLFLCFAEHTEVIGYPRFDHSRTAVVDTTPS